MESVYFPPESASIVFLINMIEVLFPICTSPWPVDNYVFRQGEGTNRRSESIMLLCLEDKLLHFKIQHLLRIFQI